MHVHQVIWHEENIGIIWEASHRCCIMRKVIHKEVTTGGRFNFFLDSGNCVFYYRWPWIGFLENMK